MPFPVPSAIPVAAALFLAISSAPAAEDAVDLYLREIKPVFAERCYACHGVLQQRSGLRLDTAELLLAGAKGGPVAVPGEPGAGTLLERLTTGDTERRMPLDAHPLTPEQIEAIRAWILAGAPLPPGERGESDPLEHWSFQRIERPPLPVDAEAAAHPVDAFLAAMQAEQDLVPQPEAERPLLLRRLYLDLVGLPPSPDQLADPRPYGEIVDELLASPHHGERWARHWMDVWRYSDSYGLGAQLRNSQKHLWRWRDWIVDSLNADKGYDRMVLEMLAGDELAPEEPEVLAATGFLARNYYLFNRTTWLDDTIEHTGKAFLGLTFNCAKCHDHKYDPVSMVDYYNFRALFEPHQVRLDPVPGVVDFEKDGLPRVFDEHLDAPTHLHLRGDSAQPDESVAIIPAVPEIFAAFAPEIEPVSLPLSAWAPATRPHVREDHLAVADRAVAEAAAELSEARRRFEEAAGEAAGEDDEGAEDVPTSGTWVSEDFSGPNPEFWELLGLGWEYREGSLVQTQVSREGAMLRSLRPHPRDFELTARYTTTGGSTWKSVIFRFDLSEDGLDSHAVYTSAHEPAPKVQVSHSIGGQSSYPAAGRANRPIEIDRSYELRFAVRDHLANVWLDGEFLFAYRLPDRHRGGRLALSGFDATVAFESLEVRALPPEAVLTEVPGEAVPSADLARALAVAEAKHRLASAERERLVATLEADLSAVARDGTPEEALAHAATLREAEAERAAALLEIARHESGGDEKKLKEAREALEKAEGRIAEGGLDYRPLRAAKKALETPEHTDDTYGPTYPNTSTGRRLMLAKWIVHRDNPLAARVAVNQVWMRHFGVPLVESVFDFGRQAPRPEHAELLDWLAVEFMDSGWSFRHLHRLLVTSEAYRRSSSNFAAAPATLAADPVNLFYWRAHPRRMESQIVRDSLLHLAGTLDPALGGPSLDPAKGSARRSLYFRQSRDDQDRFLAMFDDASIHACYRREESVVPQQALALANSVLSLEAAEGIVARVAAELPGGPDGVSNEDFAAAAFRQVLSREPDAGELRACLEFGEALGELESVREAADPAALTRARLVHALLNHNDFVTVR